MRRREMFRVTAGAALLAAPHIARAESQRPLRFVPTPDLTVLDPLFSGGRATKSHALLVFDTLFGQDEALAARPQMLESYVVENNGTMWTLRLRDGLRFHDGTPVLARDAVASIRRFAARDGFGSALMKATDELGATDDRTLRFRLTRPFPHLPDVLSGSTQAVPVIMPERLANADPFRPITEMVGSGPYRFMVSEFDAGARAAYERFENYIPRSEGTSSYTAGPKVAHLDRIEWQSIGDAATAVAALLRREVDWLEAPGADQLPLLQRENRVTVEVKDTAGSIAFMRFNHLQPPFDNPAIRRAILGAVDQVDVMTALAGTDRKYWHDRVGLFCPGSLLANETGVDVLSTPRDYDKVKWELAAAGYRGEPVVALGVTGNSFLPLISQVGTDALRRAGMNVVLQELDVGTLVRRWMNKGPPEKGGWNVFFFIIDGLSSSLPLANRWLQCDGQNAAPGWPDSPEIEALRASWLDAADPDREKRIARDMQTRLWLDVPYIPLGHWVRSTAHLRNVVDIPWGYPAFYGVRRI